MIWSNSSRHCSGVTSLSQTMSGVCRCQDWATTQILQPDGTLFVHRPKALTAARSFLQAFSTSCEYPALGSGVLLNSSTPRCANVTCSISLRDMPKVRCRRAWSSKAPAGPRAQETERRPRTCQPRELGHGRDIHSPPPHSRQHRGAARATGLVFQLTTCIQCWCGSEDKSTPTSPRRALVSFLGARTITKAGILCRGRIPIGTVQPPAGREPPLKRRRRGPGTFDPPPRASAVTSLSCLNPVTWTPRRALDPDGVL